jgi:histidinol-phosphate phosphatase family protein
VLVDEYQDTNRAQYRIIRLLTQEHRNICVVGDSDQSIYKWRGADIRNILDFEDDFPGTKVVRLEQNYRSTRSILAVAAGVIAHNVQRKDKTLWTENPGGEPARVYRAWDEHEEASFVAQSAVARGLLSEEGLAEIHQTLCARLAAAGAYLDGIYYCPHHPTEGLGAYNVVCDCRKPSPGLVRRAATDLEIDPAFSFVVGDQKSDMELAQRVGARGILIGEAGSGALPDLAVHVAADLRDAATWIVATLRGG